MGELSKQWRARADELNLALPVLMKNISVPEQVIQATKAAVVPELLLAFANLLDVLELTPDTQDRQSRLKRWSQKNQEVRLAAINALNEGKWDDFDRLINDGIAASEAASGAVGSTTTNP